MIETPVDLEFSMLCECFRSAASMEQLPKCETKSLHPFKPISTFLLFLQHHRGNLYSYYIAHGFCARNDSRTSIYSEQARTSISYYRKNSSGSPVYLSDENCFSQSGWILIIPPKLLTWNSKTVFQEWAIRSLYMQYNVQYTVIHPVDIFHLAYLWLYYKNNFPSAELHC